MKIFHLSLSYGVRLFTEYLTNDFVSLTGWDTFFVTEDWVVGGVYRGPASDNRVTKDFILRYS